jgi:hypothetical protein
MLPSSKPFSALGREWVDALGMQFVVETGWRPEREEKHVGLSGLPPAFFPASSS